jgi:hypothetical protein
MLPQRALKYDVQGKEDGRAELYVPFPEGSHLTVFVIESNGVLNDLVAAAESSTAFWDNTMDDEDWNNS